MQLLKVSNILGNDGVKILYNSKMKNYCDYMGIDIYNCDSYKNGRKYSRYFKHIVQESSEGGYTYKIWEKRYFRLYDDVMTNEWHNNMMDMCDFNNVKCAFGTSIWFALSLTAELYKIVDSATVFFCFTDILDKDNKYYKMNDYPDCPHVSFYINRPDLPDLEEFSKDFIESANFCKMLIRIDK